MRVLFALLVLCVAPALQSQEPDSTDRTQSFTACAPADNRVMQRLIVPWPTAYDGRWWDEYDALIVHERMHARQMGRFASCALYLQALRATAEDSIPLALEMEAEAGCAQARYYVSRGAEPRNVGGGMMMRLREKAPARIPMPTLTAVARRYCPEMIGEVLQPASAP